MKRATTLFLLCGGAILMAGSGCAVPQPRGEGLYQYIKEPTKGGWYHLYLPADYVKNNGRHPDYPRVKRWPLVMTFHGMRPYDTAQPQEREWEREADTYGYIVCAPRLDTSDAFMEYPITKEHGYVLRDREHVMAIMDHIFATTLADPDRVLSTSWSCGGYLAHYFVNRFPERFSCLATRLSNFSEKILIEDTVPRYRDRIPIGIFAGDSDFPACKKESEKAVAWYTARNFRIVRGKMVDSMGHKRIPQTAAAFFAEQMSMKPLHPLEASKTVAEIQMTDYYPPAEMIAAMSPTPNVQTMLATRGNSDRNSGATPPKPTGATPPQQVFEKKETPMYASSSAGRDYPYERLSEYDTNPSRGEASKGSPPPAAGASRSATPANGNWLAPTGDKPSGAVDRAADRDGPKVVKDPGHSGDSTGKQPIKVAEKPVKPEIARRPEPGSLAGRKATPNAGTPVVSQTAASRARRVNIRFNGPAVGTAPHYLQYSVDLPPDQTRGADFLWKDNGVWMGDQSSGSRVLTSPGMHHISVLLVSRDNVEYRGTATVHVLEPGPSARSSYQDAN